MLPILLRLLARPRGLLYPCWHLCWCTQVLWQNFVQWRLTRCSLCPAFRLLSALPFFLSLVFVKKKLYIICFVGSLPHCDNCEIPVWLARHNRETTAKSLPYILPNAPYTTNRVCSRVTLPSPREFHFGGSFPTSLSSVRGKKKIILPWHLEKKTNQNMRLKANTGLSQPSS